MDNDEIQRKADRLLQEKFDEVISSDIYKIVPFDFNNQTDRGIDFVFEIIERQSNQTILKFNIQNKGTTGLDELVLNTNKSYKAGFISFKLDKLRHISYWVNEINEPLIIFLCDIKNKEIYWYAIQLDPKILNRASIHLSEGKNTIQVYFDPKNKLTKETSVRLIEDIKQSKVEQNVKYNNKEFDSSYASDTFDYDYDESKSLVERLHSSLMLFKNFLVVPTHIIARQFPISKSNFNKAYVSNSTLYSTNEDLVEELSEVANKLKNNGEVSSEELEVFKFLNRNFIYHVESTGHGRNNRICIHDIIKEDTKCNCISCRYNRSEYSAAFEEVFNISDQSDIDSIIKAVYVFYKFGLYENALLLLDSLIVRLGEERNWGIRYAMVYNGKIIARLTYDGELTEEGVEVRRKIESLNLEEEFEKAKSLVGPDMYLLLRWIHDESYIYRSSLRIQSLVNDVVNSVNVRVKGGWVSNTKEFELLSKFAHFVTFVESVPIVYDNYLEFKTIIHRSFEGLILSRQILHDNNHGEYELDYFVLDKVFNHGTASDIEKILARYSGRQLSAKTYGREYSHRKLSYQIRSIGESIEEIKNATKLPSGKKNHKVLSSIRSKIENCLVLATEINLGADENQEIFDAILNYFIGNNSVRWMEKYFSSFVYKRSNDIDMARMVRYANILISNLELSDQFDLVSIIGLVRSKIGEKSSISDYLPEFISKIIHSDALSSFQRNRMLIDLHEYVSFENRKLIENYIDQILNNKFNYDIYYRAVANDVIGYEPWFDAFKNLVPTEFSEISFKESMTGEKEDMIFELNQFIQICFQFGLKIPVNIKPPSKYYEWLMNMEEFDQNQFDVFWLTKFRVNSYLNEYKRHLYIKKAVENFLSRKSDDLLSELYFNHLI